MISIIVAYDRNRVIGFQGGMPWKLSDDFQNFKKVTDGHPIIMWRKTHKSIGRTLQGRTNIVISRNPDYQPAEGAILALSLNEALAIAKKSPGSENIFITGGAGLFAEALPFSDRLYVTEIDSEFTGDVYFPEFNKDDWNCTVEGEHESDEKNSHNFRFLLYTRK